MFSPGRDAPMHSGRNARFNITLLSLKISADPFQDQSFRQCEYIDGLYM